MAEYYAVLKKAVSGMEGGAGDARRSVYDKARRRAVTVRAGHSYRARARLFQARKGRRPSP